MAKVNGTKVITNKVRLSYVHLFEPDAFEGQDPKYSTVILIDKTDTETVDAIKSAQKAAYEMAKGDKLKGLKPTAVKTTLRDGDEEKDLDEQPEYEGMYFMSLSSKSAPGLLNKFKKKATEEDVYSGVYARVSMNLFAFNTAGNKGISAGLNNVMALGEGDYLGGKASAESDFEDFEAADEDDDLEGLL